MDANSRFREIDLTASSTDMLERSSAFLKAVHELGGSSLIINSNDPMWAKIDGKWMRASDFIVSNEGAFSVLTGVFGFESAEGTIKSGNDLDFSFEIRITRREVVRFRVNASPVNTRGQQIGVSITFRPLPSIPLSVEELGVSPAIVSAFSGGGNRNGGLTLVSGETGSGKSTLLASLLRHRIETGKANNNAPHIGSYESPIEFNLSNIDNDAPIEQSEIPKHLPSFAAGARNALRRELDIVFFGEARDTETFQYVLINAEQGSEVATTLHSRSLSSAIGRVLAMFSEGDREARRQSLISSLSLMVHQKLVPTVQGKRTAVNEYLVFDGKIKAELLLMPSSNIELYLQTILEDETDNRGRSMFNHAEVLFADGQITRQVLSSIEKAATHE